MRKEKHNILVVTGFFPYPPTHGGMVDVWKRIEGLFSLGCTIDLVYTSKDKPKKEDLVYVQSLVENTFEAKRKNKITQLFSKKPLQVVSRKNLKTLKIDKSYDLIILEGDYVGEILGNKSIQYKKIVVRSHNNEEAYFTNLSKSTNNFIKKIYYKLEALKFTKYSDKLYTKSDSIWFISRKERQKYYVKNKKTKSNWLPVPFEIDEVKQQVLSTKTVLFVGSLFMENNLEGILWYLDNVHKEILKEDPNYNLVIAGSSGGIKKENLENIFKKYQNLNLYIDCPDLSKLYEEASVFINPMLHGAGVKVKSVNAIVNGLPLISTTIGAEGIGLHNNEHYFLSNTKESFKANVLTLLNDKEKGRKTVNTAQKYLIDNNYITILEKELNELKKDI